MLRIRFYISRDQCDDDYRPIKWPPAHPYWCTGESEFDFILVAYADAEDQLLEFWPEARDLDIEEVDDYVFTDRFPRPEWFHERT